MFNNQSESKDYTFKQITLRSFDRYRLICTNFYYGEEKVSWLYHIVMIDPVDPVKGPKSVINAHYDLESANMAFNEVEDFVSMNLPTDDMLFDNREDRNEQGNYKHYFG